MKDPQDSLAHLTALTNASCSSKVATTLINRWNQSDDKLDRKFDSITKEINDLDNQVSEIKGIISRLNGKN